MDKEELTFFLCFLSYKLISEKKNYKKRIQTFVDNTVNHMRYEIKVENRVKDKNNFFIKRNTAFLFSKKKIILGDILFLRFLRI